ncbi:hypothetical protein BT69DRAFT_1292341 [Atractiella rhizophila]|nr:hypothetical protein BT69DRAFT_1292341 [Atractiella rhizophila]
MQTGEWAPICEERKWAIGDAIQRTGANLRWEKEDEDGAWVKIWGGLRASITFLWSSRVEMKEHELDQNQASNRFRLWKGDEEVVGSQWMLKGVKVLLRGLWVLEEGLEVVEGL